MSLPGTRTIWEEGHEPGREMVALGVALAGYVAWQAPLLLGAALVYFVMLPFVMWFSLSQQIVGDGIQALVEFALALLALGSRAPRDPGPFAVEA